MTINTVNAHSPQPDDATLGISLIDSSYMYIKLMSMRLLLMKGIVGNNQRFQTTPMSINRIFDKF